MRNLIFVMLFACFSSAVNAQATDLMKKGLEYIQNENYAEAQKFFEGVFAKDPKNALAQYYLGQIAYKLEDYTMAESAFRKGLTANSKCAECQIGLAKLNLDGGKAAEVDKAMESLAKSNKKNASIVAMIGEVFLNSKNANAAKAVDFLTRARDINPKDASIWGRLGDAFKLKGDSGSAMSAYESAISKDPNNVEVIMKMAGIWANSGQRDLAIQKLESAIKLAPNYAPAYKLIYELYTKAGKRMVAIPYIQKYITLAGDDVKAKERLVKFLIYDAKDYDGGIEAGKKLLATNPNEYTMYRWLAWAYGEKENYEESYQNSKKFFAEVAKDNSRKTFISDYEYYAKAAMKTDSIDPSRKEEAMAAYKKVIEFEPKKAEEIWGGLAKASYEKKDYPTALKYYELKNSIKPYSFSELYSLGYIYWQMKDYKNTQVMLDKALGMNKDMPIYYLNLLAKSADYQETNADLRVGLASPYYTKLIEVAKADPVTNKRTLKDAYVYFGAMAYQNKDLAGALAQYESAALVDPADTKIQNNITALKEALKAATGGK